MKQNSNPVYPQRFSPFGDRIILMDREEGNGAPAGGEGGQAPQGDAKPQNTPQRRAIPEDVLPEEFRGKSEHEIKVLMNTMVNSLRSANERVRQYETQGTGNAHSAPTVVHNQGNQSQAQAQEPDKPLDELILEDPEKAIDIYLQKRGYVNQFQNLDQRTGEMTLRIMRNEIDDFGEYESDVKDLLKQTGAPMTEQNIMGAYTMLVGRKALEERQRNQRESQSMERAQTSAPQEDNTPRWGSSLEEEMARAQGFNDPAEWQKYMTGGVEIKVPTGSK